MTMSGQRRRQELSTVKKNSRFDPEGAVSRRDFALMLTRMLGVDVSGYTNTPLQ